MQDRDFAAVRDSDGFYVIRQYVGGRFVLVAHHTGRYSRDEALRLLSELRPYSDRWIEEGGVLRLVPP